MSDDRHPALPLRRLTQARIALGRAGQALPTRAMLDFQLAHARARDAVHAGWAPADFAASLGRPFISVGSRAGDRRTYLARPDLGRALSDAGAAALAPGDAEVAFVIADGLSPGAARRHAPPLLAALAAIEPAWAEAPVVVATNARVALGDAIGAALAVRLVVVLIGERPGLSAPESLGTYLTWAPRVGRIDSERNCVSNIRPPEGLDYGEAAERIGWLMREARRLGTSGVALKDRSRLPTLPPSG